jgi:TolB-like protein
MRGMVRKELKNIARLVRAYAIESASAGAALETHAPTPNQLGPPRLSIVVLPFANIGGGPEQEYFVDGVTESLTHDRNAAQTVQQSAPL